MKLATRGAVLGVAFLWTSLAQALPTPVTRPGYDEGGADTISFEYPVLLSPTLLSLRARSMLDAPGTAEADARPPETLVRVSEDSIGPKRAEAGPRRAATSTQDGLLFAGAKTLSVEVGRGRDASLHQTLDLTLRGRLAGDVEVAASLSDQQLPFEPDGSTRELQDLDRLFLSVRTQQGEVTMGDFRLDQSPGEFARISRQLQGVRGTARVVGSHWDVSAASAKGERRSIEARGEDGKQGPYDLLPRVAGEAPAGIVAGSETVWLDGARLKRGADQDYVVDYGAGTVTFATRHPITRESRIAFDFERASTRFHRSLYAAFTQGAIASTGRWYAGFLRDGDDPKSPLETSLTAEDRRTLSGLGDSAAAPTGARYVGAGRGEYVWDESDLASPHWVFLGSGRGDYTVAFVSVGVAKGSYADTLSLDGVRFYRFMGANRGSYVPGRSLPVPDERRLVDIGGSARVLGALNLEAEAARSGLDRNQLSSLDDGDNAGNAVRFTARLDPRPLRVAGRSLGALRASAAVRSRDGRFRTMDRLDDVFEGDRWNQSSREGAETKSEAGLQYDPFTALSLRAELGRRTLDGGSRSLRRAAAAELRGAVAGGLRWEGAENALGSDRGSRSRLSLDLLRTRGAVTPRFRLVDERIAGQEGDSIPERQSRDWETGIGVAPSARVKLRAGYGERIDRRGDPSEGLARSRRTAWEAGVSARAKTSFSLEMGWSRRRTWEPGGFVASDLAQLALLAGAPGAPLSSELRYDATQLREPQTLRRIVAVEPGTGFYDAYGTPRYRGDYQVITTAGPAAGRSRALVQFRVDAYPGRSASAPGRAGSFWRRWGSSTSLRVETLSALSLGSPRHAFDPRDYLDERATVRGNVVARQSLEYSAPGARYDVRAEIGARRDRTGEFENLRVRRDALDLRLRVRNPLWGRFRLTTDAFLDGSVQTARRTDTSGRSEARMRGRGLNLELSRSLSRAWALSMLARGRRDADVSNRGWQETLAAGPSARCAPGERLRLDGRALYARTGRGGSFQPAGLVTPAVSGRHVDYDLLGEYRLRDRVSLSLTWSGQLANGRGGAYTGRFELRSYF
ncbi:MAG: hypothetical protein HY568_02565 [Candidatus Latescibacteria bacterium]|nr:hypothetical protein [Candidatus Latescibacterota bacterium]